MIGFGGMVVIPCIFNALDSLAEHDKELDTVVNAVPDVPPPPAPVGAAPLASGHFYALKARGKRFLGLFRWVRARAARGTQERAQTPGRLRRGYPWNAPETDTRACAHARACAALTPCLVASSRA